MKCKHIDAEIKGISRIAAAIAKDDLIKVKHEISETMKSVSHRKIYETILQSYLFCGFPAVIESLKIYSDLGGERTSKEEPYSADAFMNRGMANCRSVYGKNFERLMINMETLSPALKNWMLIEGYGKVMGRKGLNLLEREFINVAILCTRYYGNQLHSHIKGCLNNGATPVDVEKMLNGISDLAGSKNAGKAAELLKVLAGK